MVSAGAKKLAWVSIPVCVGDVFRNRPTNSPPRSIRAVRVLVLPECCEAPVQVPPQCARRRLKSAAASCQQTNDGADNQALVSRVSLSLELRSRAGAETCATSVSRDETACDFPLPSNFRKPHFLKFAPSAMISDGLRLMCFRGACDPMKWLSPVIAVLLTVGMTIPAWAMRDCCCAGKAATTTRAKSCCANRVAPVASPAKKCCAARAPAASANSRVSTHHTCLCMLKSIAPSAVQSVPRLILGDDGTVMAWHPVANSLLVANPTRQSQVAADLPPPWTGSRQILLCRWLT